MHEFQYDLHTFQNSTPLTEEIQIIEERRWKKIKLENFWVNFNDF